MSARGQAPEGSSRRPPGGVLGSMAARPRRLSDARQGLDRRGRQRGAPLGGRPGGQPGRGPPPAPPGTAAWLVPVIASIFVRFWLTAIRWQLLLRPVKRIGVHRLFAITMIGFMANNVLPAGWVSSSAPMPSGASEALPPSLPFATIVIERIFDGFTLPAVPAGRAVVPPAEPNSALGGGAHVRALPGVLGGLVVLRTGRGLGLLTGGARRLPDRLAGPARRLLESFRAGLDVLSDGRALAVHRASLSVADLGGQRRRASRPRSTPSRWTCRLTRRSSCSARSRSPSSCRRRRATSAPSRSGPSRA